MTPKVKKVQAVPMVGMVKKVGKKVPRIDPTVPKASKIPTTLPEVFPEVWAYLMSEGVTVPSNNNGGMNKMKQVKKEAQMSKPALMNIAKKAVMPAITKRPKKGIKVIQVPERSMKK